MKIISYRQYTTELLGNVDKSRIYFNPDNSVSILDPSEQDVFDWVAANGKKLKEARFHLTPENADKIREYIKNGVGVENLGEAEKPEITSEKDVKNYKQPARALSCDTVVSTKKSEGKEKILAALQGKQTVASLTQLVRELAELV